MTGIAPPDLACFGYLALAQVNIVAAYPPVNTGAVVYEIVPSLAGDAPLAASTARRLGSSVVLVSNRVGLDRAGQIVLDLLDTAYVTHGVSPATTGSGTPQLIVISDDEGNRTWFAWLGDAVSQLAAVDLSPLSMARLAYLDCYRVLDGLAAAAIAACRAPLLLNLGGDPLTAETAAAASDRHIAYVQTNLDEHDADRAEHLAADLFARLNPDAAVVTLGRLGALGYTAAGAFHVQAPHVPVRHTHGAGAAFSGGLAHAHLTGATVRQAVHAGCVAGTRHCTTTARLPQQRAELATAKESHP